ncbi:hypothetical protein V8E54_005426 [Elaphomyces granulatus]
MALPGFAAEIFSAAGKKARPTIVNEKALQPDTARWWKTVNGLDGKFGRVSTSGVFEPISLEALVGELGGKGVIVNVVGGFFAKASTENKQSLTAVVPQTLQFEVEIPTRYILSTSNCRVCGTTAVRLCLFSVDAFAKNPPTTFTITPFPPSSPTRASREIGSKTPLVDTLPNFPSRPFTVFHHLAVSGCNAFSFTIVGRAFFPAAEKISAAKPGRAMFTNDTPYFEPLPFGMGTLLKRIVSLVQFAYLNVSLPFQNRLSGLLSLVRSFVVSLSDVRAGYTMLIDDSVFLLDRKQWHPARRIFLCLEPAIYASTGLSQHHSFGNVVMSTATPSNTVIDTRDRMGMEMKRRLLSTGAIPSLGSQNIAAHII